ncbi:MAG: YraN family protein [Opitutales bacterium]|nr:YraN family protein [Opitutales bacterium]
MLKKLVRTIVAMFENSTTQAQKIGSMGEDVATKYLKQKGYKILHRNFKSRRNEIDIICTTEDVLVFVEVKTRTKTARVNGYFSAVGKRKKNAVRSCAKDYMAKLKHKPKTWRFDAIEVNYLPEKLSDIDIHHYENVY